ncbi:MFS transporter [Dactylosporangium sp. CA-139114]|uniref:MFS transporter n=1 Tax=Dactylosporangium sp. CA-139114 TaxID=3239931 RepID=UPI003D96F026
MFTRERDDRPALGHRRSGGFALLWLASVTSALGNGMRWVALPLLAAGQSGDPWTISLITAAEELPWLLFGLLAGVLADRFDRRRLALGADLGRAAVMVAFTVAVACGFAPVGLIVVLGFVLTCGDTVAAPALAGLLPAVVPPVERPAANGRLLAGVQITDTLIGSTAGAALFAAAAVLPFAVDAATFLASAACLILLRVPAPSAPASSVHAPSDSAPSAPASSAQAPTIPALSAPAPSTPGSSAPAPIDPRPGRGGGIRAGITAGLRLMWADPAVRGLCLLQAVTSVAYAGIVAVLVLFATRVLGFGPAGFGLLLAVYAVGGVAGGVAAGRLARWLGPRRCLVVAVAGTVVCVAALGGARGTVAAVAAAGLLGVATTLGDALAATLRQALVPDAYIGRVTSAFRIVGRGAAPVGALAAGALAHAYGLRTPFYAGAILVAAGLAAFTPLLRKVTVSPA